MENNKMVLLSNTLITNFKLAIEAKSFY